MLITITDPKFKFNTLNSYLRKQACPEIDYEFADVEDLYRVIRPYILPGFNMLALRDTYNVTKSLVIQNILTGKYYEFAYMNDNTYNYLSNLNFPIYTQIRNLHIKSNFIALYKHLANSDYLMFSDKLIRRNSSDFDDLFVNLRRCLGRSLDSNRSLSYDELITKYNLLGFATIMDSYIGDIDFRICEKMYDSVDATSDIEFKVDCDALMLDNISYISDDEDSLDHSIRILIYNKVNRG